MAERDLMTRVSILETKEVFNQKHLQTLHDTYVRTSEDIREMRDVMVSVNLPKLSERVTNLENNRWFERGISAGIGGGASITLAKLMGFLGMVVK